MEDNMKCENCGGATKRMDGNTMKCEGCGATKNMPENKNESESTADESK